MTDNISQEVMAPHHFHYLLGRYGLEKMLFDIFSATKHFQKSVLVVLSGLDGGLCLRKISSI